MSTVVECVTSIAISQTAVMEPSTADKKRNKLGYHRTSVACVHCRRRKIRCLVAADDAQGRCENCIRLRKECQFFPVDQQPPIEKKSRPNSRIETISADASTTSSSPPTITGEQTEGFYPYQPMALNSSQEVTAFNSGGYPGNPMAPFARDATAPMDPSVPWDEFTTMPSDPQMLATMSAAGKQTMVNVPLNVWSQTATPMAAMPANPALTGAHTLPSQPQPLSPALPYAVQADGSVWQMTPTRSMTFAAQPNMSAPYPNPSAFSQPMPADLKRRMTSPGQRYTTGPINPQSPPPGLQGTPVPVPYPGQPVPMGYPGWQEVNGLPTMNMVPYPMYTGDATQQAAFGSPPMGHLGQGPPHGS